jgi:hypothetical protein
MAGGPRSRSVVRLPAARQALDFVRVSDTAEHWHGQSHPDRRRTARGALALAAVAMLACAADAPQPPEPYFARPDFAVLALSPSGKYVGALVPVRGRVALAVLELDTRTPQPVARVDGEDIRWFAWTNDDRLVFTTIGLQAGLRGSASADCTR